MRAHRCLFVTLYNLIMPPRCRALMPPRWSRVYISIWLIRVSPPLLSCSSVAMAASSGDDIPTQLGALLQHLRSACASLIVFSCHSCHTLFLLLFYGTRRIGRFCNESLPRARLTSASGCDCGTALLQRPDWRSGRHTSENRGTSAAGKRRLGTSRGCGP